MQRRLIPRRCPLLAFWVLAPRASWPIGSRSFFQMPMDEASGNDSLAQCLDEAMKAVHTAAAISGLMPTNRGEESGARRTLDLSEVCQRSLVRFRAVPPRNVEFETELPTPGPVATVDSGQLERPMRNLITNAWEAGGSGTCVIRISISVVSIGEIPEHHLFPIDFVPNRERYACLDIADTGCGIESERIDSLFDPFYSSKMTGRGLGLAVVLGVVRAHRGAIAVESRPGHGSAFRVYLPLVPEASSEPSVPSTVRTC